MATNNPFPPSIANQMGLGQAIATPNTFGGNITIADYDVFRNYRADPFPHNTMLTVGQFRIQKIANGYLVDLVRHTGGTVETHHVDGFKEAGDLITATLVRWELEGKK